MISRISFHRGRESPDRRASAEDWDSRGSFEEQEIKDVDQGRSKIAERDGCADTVDQPGHSGPSQEMHEARSPRAWRISTEGRSGQAEKGHHHGEMDDNVETPESAIDMPRFLRLHVLGKRSPSPSVPASPRSLSSTRARCETRRRRRPISEGWS